jgi:hypothetical protein
MWQDEVRRNGRQGFPTERVEPNPEGCNLANVTIVLMRCSGLLAIYEAPASQPRPYGHDGRSDTRATMTR